MRLFVYIDYTSYKVHYAKYTRLYMLPVPSKGGQGWGKDVHMGVSQYQYQYQKYQYYLNHKKESLKKVPLTTVLK